MISKLFDLQGRVALVTGAAGYLGSAMAEALAEAGATVILNGRNEKPLDDLRSRLTARGARARVEAFDVTHRKGIEACGEIILRTEGRLDVLVNNAYAPETGDHETATREQFLRSFDLCVASAFELVQVLRPCLAAAVSRSGSASVINIGSMYGSVSPDPRIYGGVPVNPPFYGPAKAGLAQLTRYLACSLGSAGIRVNCISPGPFPRPSVTRDNPAFGEALRARTALGRVGAPEDLQGAVLYLAADASRYVTGIDLPVDGGWTAL